LVVAGSGGSTATVTSKDCLDRVHDHEGEPRREVLPEAHGLERGGTAVVADHLVGAGEAEVVELVGGEPFLGHRRGAEGR